MFVAEGSDKCGELYPGVTERKEHRGQEGRQSQHHGDGEGSRKGGQGPGPCMGAGGLRGKHEHRSELGESYRRSRPGHGTKVGARTGGVGVLGFISVQRVGGNLGNDHSISP